MEKKNKILIQVPKLDSFVCPTEIGAMGLWTKRFAEIGVELVLTSHEPRDEWERFKAEALESYPGLKDVVFERNIYFKPNTSVRRTIFELHEWKESVPHPPRVGRSFAEIYRTTKGVLMREYCAEGFDPDQEYEYNNNGVLINKGEKYEPNYKNNTSQR